MYVYTVCMYLCMYVYLINSFKLDVIFGLDLSNLQNVNIDFGNLVK